MYIVPRPLIDDDPLYAVRIAAMPLIGVVLALLLKSPLPMIYPTMMFSLLANNRKAMNPGRVFSTPVVFGGALWLMSAVVAALQGLPLVLTLAIGLIYFGAFYLIQRTGNAAGMLLIVAAALMSIMGLGNYQAMAFLRAEMTKAAICAAIVIPVLYLLFPTRTEAVQVDDIKPSYDYGWATRAAIRAVVMLGYSVWLYTVLDFSNMMLAIAGMFVLCHSTSRSVWVEAGQRSFSVLLGGMLGLLILGAMTIVGHFVVLAGLLFLATLWLGTKMMSGRLPSMAYQDAASVMISLVGSGLASSEPGFVFIQRAGLTIAGTIAAALLLSVLDALLVQPATNLSPETP